MKKILTVLEIVKTRTVPIDRFGSLGKWKEIDCSFKEAVKQKTIETVDKWNCEHQIAKFYYDLSGNEIAWNSGVIVIGGKIRDCENDYEILTFEEWVEKYSAKA